MAVTDQELAAFLPKVRRAAGSIRTSIPFDDLVQEGMILVWKCLEEGKQPSMKIIVKRLYRYAKTERSCLTERKAND